MAHAVATAQDEARQMRAEQASVLQSTYSQLAETEAQVKPLADTIHDAIAMTMVRKNVKGEPY